MASAKGTPWEANRGNASTGNWVSGYAVPCEVPKRKRGQASSAVTINTLAGNPETLSPALASLMAVALKPERPRPGVSTT
jgi:hypothetical protein